MGVTTRTLDIWGDLMDVINEGVLAKMQEVLEPIFRIAETKRYPLQNAGNINVEEVSRAISQAVGEPVHGIAFLSAAQPIPKDSWMTEEGYRHALITFLRHAEFIGKKLSNMGLGVNGPNWENYVGQHAKEIWRAKCRSGIQEALETALRPVSSPYDERYCIEHGAVLAPVEFFLAAAATGNQEGMNALEPLMKILPRCIPLAEREKGRGVWVVLTA